MTLLSALLVVSLAGCESEFAAKPDSPADPFAPAYGEATGWREVGAGSAGACALDSAGAVVGWGGAERMCEALSEVGPISGMHMGEQTACGVSPRGTLAIAHAGRPRAAVGPLAPQLTRVECPGDGRWAGQTVAHMWRTGFSGLVPAGPIRDFSLSPALGECAYWIDGPGAVRMHCDWGQTVVAEFQGRYVEVAAFTGGACAVEESGAVECHLQAPERYGIETDLRLTGLNINEEFMCGVDEDGFAHCFDAVRESSGDDPLLYPPDIPVHGIAGTAGTNCALTNEDSRIVCWGSLGGGLDTPP